jgi:hypothetical protein
MNLAGSSPFQCKHKPKMLQCKECQGQFCTRCIQLEAHECPKLNIRIQKDRDNLQQKLVKVVAPKVAAI